MSSDFRTTIAASAGGTREATSYATAAEGATAWYAIQTRSRHESIVRTQLQQRNVEAFLPTVTRWSRWKDRRKRVEWPLFAGYCFARFDGRETLPILRCVGVVGIVSFGAKPAAIADEEVLGLQRVIETTLDYDPCPFIRDGMAVDIVRGPLAGVSGRLLRKDVRHATVVLVVTVINQAVKVEVDITHIEPHTAAPDRHLPGGRQEARLAAPASTRKAVP